ncbi:MAG TPA: flavodoxin family protein [bacterium]|nr:flavodoxin family protein [bacterium]
MKVLGIYGSPRAGGNSDILLDHCLDGAREAGAEVMRVYVRDLGVSGCRECGGCDQTGECVQQDDMQKIYPLLIEADAIIVATPMFFYAMPAKLKAVIDRAQAMWSRRKLKKPVSEWKNHTSGKGYMIAVGATRGKNLFDGVEFTAKYFFDALDMSYQRGLFFRQVEGKGEIENRPEALEQAKAFGREIASAK